MLGAQNLHWYNAPMRKQWLFTLLWLIVLVLFISACAQGVPTDVQTPTSTKTNAQQSTPTEKSSDTPLPTPSATPEPSPTVTQTPTPVYYAVLNNDDMYAIAYYYNISPQELMTANPSVDPRAMGPGTTLVIPVTLTPEPTPTEGVDPSPTATQTFAALPAPDCYPDALGGLWCFVLISNDGSDAYENVSGIMELQQGDETRQETALTPLNLLPPGQSLPLAAYFQPPVDQAFSVSAVVDFFLPVMPDDARYLPVEILDENIAIDVDGMAASISGTLQLPDGQPNPSYVWICATAFDEEGHILAVRRWESEQLLAAGDQLPFEFSVYSHSGPIEVVNILVEAYKESKSGE